MEKLKDTVPVNAEKPVQASSKPEETVATNSGDTETEFASVLKSLQDKNINLPSGQWALAVLSKINVQHNSIFFSYFLKCFPQQL